MWVKEHFDKLRKSIYGLAVGDALGVPYEFMEEGTFRCVGMEAGGEEGTSPSIYRADIPAGTWSDDTAMTIATLKSLADNGGEAVPSDIKKNFQAWYEKGEFTTDGFCFGIGRATLMALESGVPQKGEHDNGNGSLMRIIPLAFTDASDDEIAEVSAVTHAHPRSIAACILHVHIARRLLMGDDLADAIKTSYGEVKASESANGADAGSPLGDELETTYGWLKHMEDLTEEDISTSGYVVDTFKAALFMLLGPKSYEDAMLKIVNKGGDTDTVAAVAGGLAGIMYADELDLEGSTWYQMLRAKGIIEACMPKI